MLDKHFLIVEPYTNNGHMLILYSILIMTCTRGDQLNQLICFATMGWKLCSTNAIIIDVKYIPKYSNTLLRNREESFRNRQGE